LSILRIFKQINFAIFYSNYSKCIPKASENENVSLFYTLSNFECHCYQKQSGLILKASLSERVLCQSAAAHPEGETLLSICSLTPFASQKTRSKMLFSRKPLFLSKKLLRSNRESIYSMGKKSRCFENREFCGVSDLST